MNKWLEMLGHMLGAMFVLWWWDVVPMHLKFEADAPDWAYCLAAMLGWVVYEIQVVQRMLEKK